MNPHRLKTTIREDGKLTLEDIPFHAGDTVEVVIFERPLTQEGNNPYPLRGQPLRYVAPTESVAEAEWDALR